MKPIQKPTLKLVARLRDGQLVKGYTDALATASLDELLQEKRIVLPPAIDVHLAETSRIVSVPLDSLKALFFVKTFQGSRDYREITFFEKYPPIKGLWVRVSFYDRESTEGVVRNSLEFLVDPGFFLKPPDPQSNNELIYVVKSSLAEFRVLGVRMSY